MFCVVLPGRCGQSISMVTEFDIKLLKAIENHIREYWWIFCHSFHLCFMSPLRGVISLICEGSCCTSFLFLQDGSVIVELHVSVFVTSCLYNAVSLTLHGEWPFICIVYCYYYQHLVVYGCNCVTWLSPQLCTSFFFFHLWFLKFSFCNACVFQTPRWPNIQLRRKRCWRFLRKFLSEDEKQKSWVFFSFSFSGFDRCKLAMFKRNYFYNQVRIILCVWVDKK